MPNLLRLAALPLLLGLLSALPGCRTRWTIENRDTPVHVWLTSPELAKGGGQVHALVYVGDRKAVDGPVHFPCGVPNVVLAPLHMPCGKRRVSVVIDGGRLSQCAEIEIRGATWIRATITKNAIRIDRSGADFTCPPEKSFPMSIVGG